MNPLDYPVCLSVPKRLTYASSWTGHIPFAMMLVDAVRPEKIVELGTCAGESFCAFCQAVKELGLNTKAYAVDTWKGDHQTSFYGPFIMNDLKTHRDLYYKDFSTLIQSTFDEALTEFEDASIDILHIDGLHTYEAVRHDFETWLPKMSERGVILFHDIRVKGGDFGVWKFWDEIRAKHLNFEFDHSCGLGVIASGNSPPPAVRELASLSKEEAAKVKKFFSKLGNALNDSASRKVEILEKVLPDFIKCVSDYATPYILTGKIFLALNQAETARREFYKILDVNPEHVEANIGMSGALMELGFTEEAKVYLLKAMELAPQDMVLKKSLASLYLQSGKISEAEKLYHDVIENNEKDIDALIPLAGIYCQLNDLDKARTLCRKIISFYPDNEEAKKILSIIGK